MYGDSAIDVLENMKIDLLLLDVIMPGKSRPEDIDRALELGATTYIVKPFRAELLRSKTHNVLIETAEEMESP